MLGVHSEEWIALQHHITRHPPAISYMAGLALEPSMAPFEERTTETTEYHYCSLVATLQACHSTPADRSYCIVNHSKLHHPMYLTTETMLNPCYNNMTNPTSRHLTSADRSRCIAIHAPFHHPLSSPFAPPPTSKLNPLRRTPPTTMGNSVPANNDLVQIPHHSLVRRVHGEYPYG